MIKWTLKQVVKGQDIKNIGGNVTEQKIVFVTASIRQDLHTMFKLAGLERANLRDLTVRDMSDVTDDTGLEQGNCQQYNGVRAQGDDWSCFVWQTSNNSLRAMLQRYGDMDNTAQYIFTGIDTDVTGM